MTSVTELLQKSASARSIFRNMAPCWHPNFGHCWDYCPQSGGRSVQDVAKPPCKISPRSVMPHLRNLLPYKTRGSAIAEEPRDALRQFKYYGRFLTELLTRSSANTEEPCEHNVSWNRVKCCTNVRRIACENVCNRWMTFSVIQGHCCWHHLIGHILFPISLPL